MENRLALIGYGEAGRTFAGAAGWENGARVFDIAPLADVMAADGVTACNSMSDSVADVPIVLCLVTADSALGVAEKAAPMLSQGALFCDMNSIAPDTKRAAAKAVEAAGGRYLDVAVMAPVNPARLNVPLLVSGPHAQDGAAALADLGFNNIRIVGDDVGRASTIKMLRSVMYKGVEALTAECLIACERAGVTDEVLASFGNDWSENADYRLDRMLVHGLRRSAEMVESSQTLLLLGVSPMLTEGTVGWQQALGDLALNPPPEGLKAKLAAILENMP